MTLTRASTVCTLEHTNSQLGRNQTLTAPRGLIKSNKNIHLLLIQQRLDTRRFKERLLLLSITCLLLGNYMFHIYNLKCSTCTDSSHMLVSWASSTCHSRKLNQTLSHEIIQNRMAVGFKKPIQYCMLPW